MPDCLKFYIGGAWIEPEGEASLAIIDPSDESVSGQVAIGSRADVDKAVAAARSAFESYSQTSRDERLALLGRIIEIYERRQPELAAAITLEMGAPSWLAEQWQVVMALNHLKTAHAKLADYKFTRMSGPTLIVHEPIGVCAMITPWNWPLNQIAVKVAPALATGCTMILKPSEVAPYSATIFAEILDEAGVPAGVFNLVHGDGPGVGTALSEHPDVDLVSFTGSTRAGVEVARAAAATVKRVHQELGGKSPFIILPSADIPAAVGNCVTLLMLNSGQSCSAPTRLLVAADQLEEVTQAVKRAAEEWVVGKPTSNAKMGPVVSEAQWVKIQGLIDKGVAEGATLVTGGAGRPEGLEKGYYVRPTVFSDVTNDMAVAREEIFGPVLSILSYGDVAEAISIANDTPYGLAAYVHGEHAEAGAVAAQLRAGQVALNSADVDFNAPFGGYKQSGNGREWGELAFGEFLETKAILGAAAA